MLLAGGADSGKHMEGLFVARMVRNLCVLVVGLVAVLGLEHASAREIADLVQDRYQSLSSFRAFFTQQLYNAASKKKEERLGSIVFAKPKSLRWETTSPEEEVLVVGPRVVWEYLPEDGVAYRYAVDEVFRSKTMLRFLSGEVHLKQDFQVRHAGEDAGLQVLELTPLEPEPGLTLARLWVRGDDGLVERIHIVDFFGNTNTLHLKAIEVDPTIDPQLFQFTPPQGVRVLEDKTE